MRILLALSLFGMVLSQATPIVMGNVSSSSALVPCTGSSASQTQAGCTMQYGSTAVLPINQTAFTVQATPGRPTPYGSDDLRIMNAIGSTATSGNFGWTAGTAFTFNMSYNAATQALRITGNGLNLIVNIAASTLIRDLVIQTQAVTPGSIMTISDLVVDGVNLSGSRSQATQANLGQQIDNLWITGLRDSFQISGRIQMSWYSTAPTGTSNSASFRFGTANNTPVVFSSVVSEVPEPGTYAMFGIALLGLAAWRMRSSPKA